jgi:hypothetical protein
MKSSELCPFAPGRGSGVAARCGGSDALGGATDPTDTTVDAVELVGKAAAVDETAGGGLTCALAGGFAGVRVQATTARKSGTRLRSGFIALTIARPWT